MPAVVGKPRINAVTGMIRTDNVLWAPSKTNGVASNRHRK